MTEDYNWEKFWFSFHSKMGLWHWCVRLCLTLFRFALITCCGESFSQSLGGPCKVRSLPPQIPRCINSFLPYWWTSHASIVYRKQLPLQRTVGTIGSVWLESTPSKETTGPAKTRKANAMKMNSRKCQTTHALRLLEPAGFSQLVLVLDL